MTELRVVEEEASSLDVMQEVKKIFTPKSIGRFVVGSSVRFVVASSISALVPVENRKDRAKVYIASYAISGMIGDKAKDYIEEEIGQKIEFCRGVIAEVKKRNAEAQATNPTT